MKIFKVYSLFLGILCSSILSLISFTNKNSYWKLTPFDIGCGILSCMAIVLWLVFNNAIIGLIFAILADSLATIPTLAKSWKYPETETSITYWGYLLSAIIILFIVPEWNFENIGFLIALILGNMAILFSIYRK